VEHLTDPRVQDVIPVEERRPPLFASLASDQACGCWRARPWSITSVTVEAI